jgi:hypothetical protein
MNAKERTFYVCGKCERIHEALDAAKRCCICETDGCTETVKQYHSHCEEHYKAWRDKEEQERRTRDLETDRLKFEKAAKIPASEYDGPVYADGMPGTCGEGYYSSVGDLLESLYSDESPPEYCWATSPLGPIPLSARDILEGAMDEYHEDAIQDVDVTGLQKLLDAWSEENVPASFEADFSRAIVLRKDGDAVEAGAGR